MVIQLLLLVAATLPTTAEAIGVSSSCAATNNGSTGRVGCTFSVDIDKSKHNFLIQRYDLNIGGEPDDVLACTWTSEGLTCDVKSTYQFDYKVSSKVVLEIPRLTENHEGMYLCAVLPQSGDNKNVKSCQLKVNEREETKRPKSTTAESRRREPQQSAQDKSQDYMLVTGILAGALGMGLVSGAILCFVFR
ncbi:hypothetical protein BaRGS_00038537 [Batillaria attramentaria]|uniref:Ig-like domain-containing protein n=1 Tax=Batillaria attramentaria TaxID=370345 RepID=A0ABD0J663_9CAEN